ncbi:MAG: MarR family transcriptional regulator [Dermatophilus congolensis]|nr:MarR family transcriptional regulator [Dermatophilus congolensis]
MLGPPDAPDSLGDLFLAVSRLLRRDYLDALEPHGITPHQGRALRVVVDRGPLRLGMLAEALRVAPRSVTDVVDALETAGLVRRFPDPDDRRAIAVEATDAGRATAEAAGRLRREHADGFFGSLTDADRRELARLLRSLLNQGQR